MTPIPATRQKPGVEEKIAEAVACCDEAVRENERVVDTITELLNASDTGRPDRLDAKAR